MKKMKFQTLEFLILSILILQSKISLISTVKQSVSFEYNMTSGQVKLIGDYDVIISALNKYLENFAQEKSQIHLNSFTDLEFVIIKDLLRVLIQLRKLALMEYLKKKQIWLLRQG